MTVTTVYRSLICIHICNICQFNRYKEIQLPSVTILSDSLPSCTLAPHSILTSKLSEHWQLSPCILILWHYVFLGQLICIHVVKKSPVFKGLKSSSLYLQKPNHISYQFTVIIYFFEIHMNLHLLAFQVIFFLLVSLLKLYMHFSCSMCGIHWTNLCWS